MNPADEQQSHAFQLLKLTKMFKRKACYNVYIPDDVLRKETGYLI
jgi:hypothetical protein